MAHINGKIYKRTKGRMYRSYFTCIEENCNAEVMVNDLKGGYIRIIRDHRSGCKSKAKGKVIRA